MSETRHRVITPSVLYFGTPVALISTLQPDGTTNLSPMSSVWALDDRLVVGLGSDGQCLHNLIATGEAVVNLPSEQLAGHVERIARTTGRRPVPPGKEAMGYEHEPDKFARARLTRLASECVRPARVGECPLQLEAVLVATHPASPAGSEAAPDFTIAELRVVRVHAHESVTVEGTNHLDLGRWRPLFYVFRHYFGLGERRGRNFRAEP